MLSPEALRCVVMTLCNISVFLCKKEADGTDLGDFFTFSLDQ